MKISVIIPTLNRATLLVDTLDSLAAQDYDKADFEVLVVDNGSLDGTAGVVAAFREKNRDTQIRYIYEPRPGLVWARHVGARAAAHDILAFTDDDGLLATCWLREIARVFALNEKVAAVAGRITILWDVPPPGWVIPYEGHMGRLDYGNEVIVREGLFINGGNFSIRKEILAQLGGFNPDQVGERLIGDGETGLCHKLHTRGLLIGWAPLALMKHRQFVTKNATVADIRRRFANNGIGVPYRLYAIDLKGAGHLLINLVHVVIGIVRLGGRSLAAAWRVDEESRLRIRFQMAFCLSQIPYTLRVLFSPAFRKELRRDYWCEVFHAENVGSGSWDSCSCREGELP